MIMFFIRALFVLIISAVLFASITSETIEQNNVLILFGSGMVLAALVLVIDWLKPKKSLSTLAAIFFGLLAGIFISWAMSFVVDMINNVYRIGLTEETMSVIKWVISISICYLVISFVMRTKDDIRFVIPYVEFARQTKGVRPLVLDTSVIIDGRVRDIAQAKLFDSPLVVPRFVLNELQLISDSSDKLKRARGRRGLDMLHKMQEDVAMEIKIDDTPPPGVDAKAEVDQKLVAFTKACDGKLVTNDYNLNKVARLREVDVININDIANALKPIVLPGEAMQIKVIKPGEDPQQGIGYLEDGTMVVIEDGRGRIGEVIEISITSSLQTSAGRMIFGKYEKTVKPARAGQSGTWVGKKVNGSRKNSGQ